MKKLLLHSACSFLLTMLMCAACLAETFTSTVQIAGGDVPMARQEAIKGILWDAGLQGRVNVHSKTALVQDRLVESTIVSSRTRLTGFTIVSEKIVGAMLTIIARVEKQNGNIVACESSLPFRNIKLEWQRNVGYVAANRYHGDILLGDLLMKTLHREMGQFLAPEDSREENMTYRVVG